jgi:hypothetical protein
MILMSFLSNCPKVKITSQYFHVKAQIWWISINFNWISNTRETNARKCLINTWPFPYQLETQLCATNHCQALPDDNYCFQGDHVPVHRARVTKTLMDESEIKTIEWPVQSPDLNIIVNVWLENENWVAENFWYRF